MKPLKSRDQTTVGAVTVVLLLLSLFAAYNAKDLPIIGGGTTYSAHFAESAGLKDGNEVQLAGVKVGEVTDVQLDGTQVLATFRVDRQGRESASRLGADSTAAIEIKSLLGEKMLTLTPRGDGRLDPSEPIPVERTTTPFDIQDAFDQLEETSSEVDTEQLAESFDTISETFSDTPEHTQEALNGLSSLSETVASRDEELKRLLSNTEQISELLSSRTERVQKVIEDANLLLSELQSRKEAIDRLLSGTQEVSQQLSGLVADNRAQLRPTLQTLDEVTDVLKENQDNLSRSLELLAPFTRLGGNALGNGRWFEGYFCGFLPPSFRIGDYENNPEGCERPVAAPDQGIERE
ncbi:MCE family protein [Haloechinothrix sp. YIM 98757]|uniref:MCE family protein n=1 Tax=Haloechinothrix aidingensis TaxID=2752311 RepID=A0A838ACS5_9PSEU|nr:MCE family protein [Haloechinothrix aidingensis]MBA0126958.1 MCE family protein [Haloechinothrix aidingensis]